MRYAGGGGGGGGGEGGEGESVISLMGGDDRGPEVFIRTINCEEPRPNSGVGLRAY